MKFISLFSGIGGFDLGFERAGMQCVLQVEKDDKARAQLKKHWPDVEQREDVRDVTAENTKPVDLICGGFPCQDVSVAGQRKGLAGERSGLWFEFSRIIDELKPEWVVIENVPGLLSSNGGRDLTAILSGLEKCGYWWAYRTLDAQFFGVPQRRRRVFIVASLTAGCPQEVLFERDSSPWDTAPSREAGAGVAKTVAFSAGNSGESYGLGCSFDHTPPLRAGNSGTNQTPTIAYCANNFGLRDVDTSLSSNNQRLDGDTETFIINDQGGNNINLEKTGLSETIRSETHGNLPIICNTFNGYTGGVDDNDAQGWHIVPSLSETLNSGGNDGGFRTEPGAHVVAQDVAYALRANGGAPRPESSDVTRVTSLNVGVRRLTPLECERLQGFPDGWTAGQSDSARYRQLGNAVAVPVAEWLGWRIVEATQ